MVKGLLAAFALLAATPVLAHDGAPPAVVIPQELLDAHDFSLADTPNKRTALAYLYTAWNEGRLPQARLTYWQPGSFPELERTGVPDDLPPNIGAPRYTIHRVIEEGDQVVVLAFVEGVGIGSEFTNVFGQTGIKVGDAVVEVFRFAPSGLIAAKVDVIEPLSEASYDFR
jgi:hypothetical protein